MRKTWNITLPKTLLLPSTDRLAVQQGLLSLKSNNLSKLKLLFDNFSAYTNLPFGLNSAQRKYLRQHFQQLKQHSTIPEIGDFVKHLRSIKDHHTQRMTYILQHQLSIYSICPAEDLLFIALKIIPPISNYINYANNELKHKQHLNNKTINLFKTLLSDTEQELNRQKKVIANNMLCRLQAADANNNLAHHDIAAHHSNNKDLTSKPKTLSRQAFLTFHRFIEQHGNEKCQQQLGHLSWIKSRDVTITSIINPPKLRRPKWLFRREYIMHKAIGDPYHEVTIIMLVKRLDAIKRNDPYAMTSLTETIDQLGKEYQRIRTLRRRLMPWFHKRARQKLNNRLLALNQYITKAEKLRRLITADIKEFEERELEQRNAAEQYNHKRAKRYFEILLTTSNKEIVIDEKEFQRDQLTYQQMLAALNDQQPLQFTLLQQIFLAKPDKHFKIHQLIADLGTDETRAIWQNRIERYRSHLFTKIVIDGDNADQHLQSLRNSLEQVSLAFPNYMATHQSLPYLIENIPLNSWNLQQHQAIELLQFYPLLNKYYKNIIHYLLSQEIIANPALADAIIHSFTHNHLLEIEFPHLRHDIQRLIQKRGVEKEARVVQQPPQTKDQDADELYQQILDKLQNLLTTEKQHEHYLDAFSQLKALAAQLPFSQKYASVKRLCDTGPHIAAIISQLPTAILTFTNRQSKSIELINPLLLDIIKHDLIKSTMKASLQQLIDLSITDSQNSLPQQEKMRLIALKKCLEGTDNENDRLLFFKGNVNYSHRLTQQPTQSQPKGEPTHASPTITP